MVRELIRDESPVHQVSDIESKLPEPSYTYNTVAKLKESLDYQSWYILIGEDQLTQIKSWYQWENLISENHLIVYPRTEMDLSFIVNALPKNNIQLLESVILPYSSTQMRENISEHLQETSPQVQSFIREKGLYV